jgi:hypothetical protein
MGRGSTIAKAVAAAVAAGSVKEALSDVWQRGDINYGTTTGTPTETATPTNVPATFTATASPTATTAPQGMVAPRFRAKLNRGQIYQFEQNDPNASILENSGYYTKEVINGKTYYTDPNSGQRYSIATTTVPTSVAGGNWPTREPSPTAEPTVTIIPSPTPEPTATGTPEPTATGTAVPGGFSASPMPTTTPTPTATATGTAVPTATETAVPTAVPTETATPAVFNPLEYDPSVSGTPTWRSMTNEDLLNRRDRPGEAYIDRNTGEIYSDKNGYRLINGRSPLLGQEGINAAQYNWSVNSQLANEKLAKQTAEETAWKTGEGKAVPMNWGAYDKAAANNMMINPSTSSQDQLAMLQKRALQRFNNDSENIDYGIFLGTYYPLISNQIKTIDRLDKDLVAAQQYYDDISKRQTEISNQYAAASARAANIDIYADPSAKEKAKSDLESLTDQLRAANTDLGNARENLKNTNTEHKAAGKELVSYFASAYKDLGGLKTSFIERDGILYGITVDELNKTVNVFTPMMQGAKTPAMQQNIAQVTEEVKQAVASGNIGALPATPAAATVAAASGGVGGGGGGRATTITGASNVPGGVGLILPSIGGGGGGGSGSIPVQPDVRYEIRKDGTLVKNTYDLRTNALLSSTTNLTDKDYTEVYGPRVVSLNRDGSQTLQYGANGPKFTIEATEESIAKANDLFVNKTKADKLTLEKLTEDLDASRRTRALEIPKTVYELGRQRAADIAEAQKASAEAARSRADIQLKEQQNKLSDLVAAGKITIPQALRFMGKFQEAAIEVERARQNFEAERSKRMEEKARAQEFADKYETEDQITNVLNAAGGKVGQAQNAARQAALAQYAGATPGQKLANLRGFDTSYQDPGLFANTDLYKNLNAPMTPEAFGLTPTSDILSTWSSNLGNKNPLQDYINSPESLAYLNAVRSLQTPATSPTMPEFFSTTMR